MKGPDLALLDGVVAPPIIDALHIASGRLRRMGIRHVLIGAVAVNAYGRSRTTKDIDFLVGPEAFDGEGVIVSHRSGVPLSVDGVAIDYLTVDMLPTTATADLMQQLDVPMTSRGVPIIRVESLILMKLAANRRRDQDDVLELVRLGASKRAVREYLTEHALDLVGRFDELTAEESP